MKKNKPKVSHVSFKPKPIVLAVKHALPYLVALGLGAAAISPAVGRSGDSAAAFTATQLIRQFTLKNTVAQVSQGMQGYVAEFNGVLRASEMGGVVSGYPVDMRSVPSSVNLPQRDGAGRPLGYCAWDNSASTSNSSFLAGQGVANPLVYAVVSPGLNGSMETSCAYILANRRGLGDDYVQVTAPSQTSSKQFKSAVGTYAELTSMPGEEGDIRLVLETNKLYSYVGGGWQPVDASKFNDDSAVNGAGAIAYTTGKVTVADFQAASATITGTLSGSAATFTSSVTANSFVGNGAALTDLNASNVNSGLLGAAFGGTGVDSSAAAQGSLLIGTGAGFALGAISAGDGIGVLNGAGSITISNTGVLSITGTNNQVIASAMNGDVVLSLPQDIATTSTPTFAGAMFNGNIDVASISQAGVPATLAFQYASDTGSSFYPEPNLGLGSGALAGRKNAGNVAIGMDVLGRMTTLGYYDESGTWNTGVGYQALYSNDYGDENTAVGYKSLYSNTTGYYNTAMGSQSMLSNTTGTANTAIGYDAMRMNTTGSGNTSLGVASLHNNTTGYRNVALGRGAMYYNTTGYRNAMVGQAALHYNTEGHQNAGVGQASIYLNTTGYYNASVGAYGLYFNTTGAENSSVGANSLLGNVSGNRNSALGYQANVLSGALNYASAIGADSRVGTSDTVVLGALGVNKNSTYSTIDDQIVIGATARNDTFPNTKLYVEGNLNLNGDLYAANATFSGAVNFQGGVLVPTDQKLRFGGDFENSDSQFIYRSNLADDQTVMRVVIGDNPNTFGHPQADEFQIGRLEGDQLTYTPVFRVAGNGDVIASGTISATRLLLSDSAGGVDEPNVIIGVGAMAGAASGGGANTAIGINALNQNTSGFKNIAVGNIALFNNTVGNKNTGVGYGALFGNTTGSNNTAVGDGVAYSMTTGDKNTALGQIAMFSNTSGEENTAIGQAAMYSNITGYMNTVVGQAALFYNTVGYQNTAIGAQALFANTTGRDNTAIGSLSLLNNTTGISNTAVGDSSLYFNTTGEKNAALGDNSLRSNTTGFRNVAIGQSSLRGNTTGSRNVALGDDAGYANSAFDNTNANISGSNNTFLGANAMPGTAAQLSYATALGSDALVTTSNTIALGRITDTTVIGAAGAATSGLLLDKAFQVTGDIGVTGNFEIGGTFTAPSAIFAGSVTSSRLNVGTLDGVSSTNTIIGLNAIEGVQSGLGSNVAVGESAMRYNTTGAYNTAVGTYALFQNSAGGGNTTLGAFAGAYMDSSSLVTAIGDHAAVSADGSESVAIGAYALSQFLGLYHVSVGNNSLGSLTTGNANTALGHYAMPSLASGDTNIAIGHRSGNTITTGSRNILIGDLAGDGTLTSNNNIALGNSATIGDALSYAVTIGNDSSVTTSNTVVLGRTIDNIVMGATGDDGSGNKLQVTGGLRASGNVFLNTGDATNYTQLRDLRVMSSVDDAGWDHLRIYTRGRKTSIDAGGAEDGLVFRVGQGGSGGVGDQTYNTVLTLKPDQSAVFTGRVDVQSLYVNGEQIAPVNKANIDTALTFASTVGAAYPQSSLALGVNALDADPRAGNIAIGDGVLTSLSPSAINTEGIFNTGVGFNALTLNSTGSNNTAVGTYTLNRNTTGYANTAIGVYAMVNTTTGHDNTGIGVNALNSNTTGNRNNALGVNALFSNSSGAQNNALGTNSLFSNTTGYQNVAVGDNALYTNSVGYQNVAVGPDALYNNTTGYQNIAIGYNSQRNTTTGYRNTAVGANALLNNTDGFQNSAFGVNALLANTGGDLNSAMGVNAMLSNTLGERNVAMGFNTLQANTTGSSNVAIGVNAMLKNTTGNENTAVGDNALFENTTGHSNAAVGRGALNNNTTGYYNIAVGRNALLTNSTGYNNSALGYNSLIFNTTGYNNAALGRNTLQNNTTGLNNTALGTYSMFGSTTGFDNTAVGLNSLYSNTTGNSNVSLGMNALFGNATGSYNMGLGRSSDVLLNNLNYASAIGAFARVTTSNTLVLGALGAGKDGVVSSVNDQVVIGTTSRNDTISDTIFHVAGVSNFSSTLYATGGAQISTNHSLHFGPDSESTDRLSIYRFNPAFDQSILRISIGDNIKTFGEATGDELQVGRLNPDNSFNAVFRVAGNGDVIASGYMQATAFNVSSDRRLKTNIRAQDSGSVLSRLEQLQTYSYEYLANPNLGRRIGVIAQEIQGLFPEAVATRADGMMSVDYSALGAMAAMGVGQLSKQVKVLDKTVADQGQRITVLDEQINQHDTRITSLESWRTDASKRMDGMQTAIDLNIQKIAENAVAIQTNSVAIERLDDALFTLDGQVKNNSDLINNINSRWAKNFSESADGSLLTVNAVELKVSNFTAQQLRANSVYSQRLEAEMARIADLEVNNLKANSAVANTVRAEQVNTGSAQVYAGVGLPAVLFAAKSDGHYTVSTSALDGSYATATVIVNAGQAKVVSVASEGIELYAEGNQVKVIAAGKSIKASWIKMG
ncbi:tail fiber domain-containing protein [Limnobacter sp.]|uniref:tail fiber domain-containing protein n=1 Tax=Limnobacter sp. TaxID=2003368 RepID=UPI0027B9F3C3|nr:tail fiber domain-containing protein [Limnobacter sp.]